MSTKEPTQLPVQHVMQTRTIKLLESLIGTVASETGVDAAMGLCVLLPSDKGGTHLVYPVGMPQDKVVTLLEAALTEAKDGYVMTGGSTHCLSDENEL